MVEGLTCFRVDISEVFRASFNSWLFCFPWVFFPARPPYGRVEAMLMLPWRGWNILIGTINSYLKNNAAVNPPPAMIIPANNRLLDGVAVRDNAIKMMPTKNAIAPAALMIFSPF
jgi:hypothetical protein